MTPHFTFGAARHDAAARVKLDIQNLNLWYDDGRKHALKDISLTIHDREVTAFIGPSGCGKSSLIHCLNRIAETIPGTRITGDVRLDGTSIWAPDIEADTLRRRFGWVAQQPNPFPRSVYDNVAYGARLHGLVFGRADTDAHVESCLIRANLWDEVKDRLAEPGRSLSGGQQQRLCIARALATNADVILMDEPCSALDPAATAQVEALIGQLRTTHAVVIITHNLGQAARVSQRTAFFYMGRMLEIGDTAAMLVAPQTAHAQAFVGGRVG